MQVFLTLIQYKKSTTWNCLHVIDRLWYLVDCTQNSAAKLIINIGLHKDLQAFSSFIQEFEFIMVPVNIRCRDQRRCAWCCHPWWLFPGLPAVGLLHPPLWSPQWQQLAVSGCCCWWPVTVTIFDTHCNWDKNPISFHWLCRSERRLEKYSNSWSEGVMEFITYLSFGPGSAVPVRRSGQISHWFPSPSNCLP